MSGGVCEKVLRGNLSEKKNAIAFLMEHLRRGHFRRRKKKLYKGGLSNVADFFFFFAFPLPGHGKPLLAAREATVSSTSTFAAGVVQAQVARRIDIEKCRKEALLEVPPKNRTTQRAVAEHPGTSRQTLHDNLKKG